MMRGSSDRGELDESHESSSRSEMMGSSKQNDGLSENPMGEPQRNKPYTLDGMIFATSGSIILEEESIKYIRERMILLSLDLPDEEIAKRAHAR